MSFLKEIFVDENTETCFEIVESFTVSDAPTTKVSINDYQTDCQIEVKEGQAVGVLDSFWNKAGGCCPQEVSKYWGNSKGFIRNKGLGWTDSNWANVVVGADEHVRAARHSHGMYAVHQIVQHRDSGTILPFGEEMGVLVLSDLMIPLAERLAYNRFTFGTKADESSAERLGMSLMDFVTMSHELGDIDGYDDTVMSPSEYSSSGYSSRLGKS